MDDGNAMGNNQKTMVEERWLDDGYAVVQYLQMARWRQRPHPLIVHSLLCCTVENENASPETIK